MSQDEPQLRIRLIDHGTLDKDLEIIAPWWTAHNHPIIPAMALPKVGILVVDQDDTGRAAGWLYECNSASVAWIEWIVTNPENSPFMSMRAVRILIDFLVLEATQSGYAILLSTCRQKSLGKLLEKAGFAPSDEEVSHYIRLATEKPR